MDIVRIATAGSVDNGKSTLIGRLLYDTGSVSRDKLDAIETSSKRKGLDFTDLSLLTDGLIEERQHGITIDVAHIYFSTPLRKYIIADSPGHLEYTRNMITGASNASAIIIVIDAEQGVIEQTKRHLFIASLLRVNTVLVCINKMDLVNYDSEVFYRLQSEVLTLSGKAGFAGRLLFIPVSAKYGHNITELSDKTSWYTGKSLLQHLEELLPDVIPRNLPLRMPVQLVLQNTEGWKGFAGKIVSGSIRKEQIVTILPSMQEVAIHSILHSGQEVPLAVAGESVTLEIDKVADISRGSMIVDSNTSLKKSTAITATICWFSEEPLLISRTYILQHSVNRVKAKIAAVLSKLDISSFGIEEKAGVPGMNDIVNIQIETEAPIFADIYKENQANGYFILIDSSTNETVAVGFIELFN